MSKEAMKLALGKIKAARDCHFKAIDPLLFEAEEILEAALAKPDFWEGYVPEPTMYLESGGLGYGPAPERKLIIGYVNKSEQPVKPATEQSSAEQPAQQQEPGRNHWEDGDVFERIAARATQPAPVQQCMDHGECFGGKCIYPSPQPAQRKPLTDEEIVRILRPDVWAHVEGATRKRMLADARAIEAAHGIKENT